jgi:ethanolamine ammonia-lyase small subunit
MIVENDWKHLRELTAARIALGRAGHSLPTRELLAFQLAHAQARDAVHRALDPAGIAAELAHRGLAHIVIKSAATGRATYLRRPDLGRRVAPECRVRLAPGDFDAVIVIADGLSANAVHHHALGFLEVLLPALEGWSVAPMIIVEQGRVAIGDEIGQLLNARLAIVLIGERPGLSSPDSLGVYLTWAPHLGCTDAERNCISNIRTEGLDPALAARRVASLARAARSQRLTGVHLKEGQLLE